MNINKVPSLVLLIKAKLNISQYRDIQVLAGNFFPYHFQLILPEIKIVSHGDEGKLLFPEKLNIARDITLAGITIGLPCHWTVNM